MSDIRLTNEKMNTYEGKKVGTFKAAAKLAEFGERQNEANIAVAANVNDLIRRVCALEDKQLEDEERFRKVAEELSAFKKELDRLRLSDKLNTSAVERLNAAIKLAEGDSNK